MGPDVWHIAMRWGFYFSMTDYSQIPDCFYRISIKALILDEFGKFLLCREDNGKWDFPGG